MQQGFNAGRMFVAAIVATSLLATSGCGWFRSKKDPYKNAPENRPLEIPPDLDRPNTDPAMAIPALPRGVAQNAPATVGAAPQALSVGGAFVLDDALDSAWRRVGLALERMDGVSLGTRSEALRSIEVSFSGQQFLIRLQGKGSGTEVSAVAADGRVLSQGPAAELLERLRARLG